MSTPGLRGFAMSAEKLGDRAAEEAATRAGYVLLAGLPNAGKSTLLNTLVGEHLSIVTAKAQTTWQRVAGIRTDRNAQMIFLDTPGIIAGGHLLHRSMLAEAEWAGSEADVAIVVVDGAGRASAAERERLFDFVRRLRCPTVVAVNKSDHPRFNPGSGTVPGVHRELPVFTVSAKKGTGLDELLEFVRPHLPESPFLYPEDHIAAAPARFFVQELVRETVFEHFHQEIPYSVAVRVEEFRENENPVYIAAALYAERKSQKGMLIGKRGTGIRVVGGDARRKIEHFLGRRVYLDLWVKVWDGWRRKKEGLMTFGYSVPDDVA